MTEKEAALAISHAPKLSEDEYWALLAYLRHTGQSYQPIDIIPRPPHTEVLLNHALRPTHFAIKDRTFSTQVAHQGNSAIQYENRQTSTLDTGNIQTILQMPLDGSMHTFIIVQPHQPLSPEEERLAPFAEHPHLMTRIYNTHSTLPLIIIEPRNVITHLTTYERPSGTYGIHHNTVVVCWSLNRGRR